MVSAVVGPIAYLILVFLPGAWITFLVSPPALASWARLLIGIALSPLVVLIQFYVLRLSGLVFETTATLIPWLNIPALYVVWRRLPRPSLPQKETLVACLLVLALPLVLLGIQFRDPQVKAYTGHAWMQADVIYALANGDLIPEEMDLAGIRLVYPWAGHVYEAIRSYVLGSSPLVNYGWNNLFALLVIGGLVAGLAAELGGGRLARVSSIACLFFGVNFAGYILMHLAHQIPVLNFRVWGD